MLKCKLSAKVTEVVESINLSEGGDWSFRRKTVGLWVTFSGRLEVLVMGAETFKVSRPHWNPGHFHLSFQTVCSEQALE